MNSPRLSTLAACVVCAYLPLVQAAASDCQGDSLDGRAFCIAATLTDTHYSACSTTQLTVGQAFESRCAASVGFSGSGNTEAQLTAYLGCLLSPGSATVVWAPDGAVLDSFWCGTLRSRTKYGVSVQSYADVPGYYYGGLYAVRKRTGTCPQGYTPEGADPLYPDYCKALITDRVHDKAVQSCSATQPMLGHPIYPLTAAKSLRQSLGDWRIGGRSVILDYHTRRKLPSDTPELVFRGAEPAALGELWTTSLHKHLEVRPYANGTIAGVYLARGAGAWISFIRDTSSTAQAERYTADADVQDQLTRTPTGWRFTDMAMRAQETFDSSGKLLTVAYADGQTLTYTYTPSPNGIPLLSAVQDQHGRSVQFTYEQSPSGAARIRQITEPNGRITNVAYTASGHLSQLTWPDGKTVQYLHERADLPWAVTGSMDENASRLATYSYDAQGRAIDTQWAGGADHYSVTYAVAPQWHSVDTWDSVALHWWRDHYWIPPQGLIVTLPNGSTATLGTTMSLGMAYLNTQTQSAGSGCAASVRTQSFDANSNVTNMTDFNGNRTCYVHDPARNLERLRIEGLPNTTSCASVTGNNLTLPPSARKHATRWHPDWPLPVQTAQPGLLTTSLYQGQADPFNAGTIANCAAPGVSLPMLPDGKPLALLCKQVEQSTLDPSGNQGLDLAARPAIAIDPQAAQTVLHLRMDGLHQDNVFTDASPSSKTPTHVIAPAVTDIVAAKYGSAAGNFTGGYLWYADSPDFDMAGGDFTIETWAKFNTEALTGRLFIAGKSGPRGIDNTIALGKDSNNLLWVPWTTTSGSGSLTDTVPIVSGTWIHIAVTRQSNTLTLWKNGVSVASSPITSFIPSPHHFAVGALGEYTDYYGGPYGTKMMGSLDELRITKGLARYSAPFTPPTTVLGAATAQPARASLIDPATPARTRQWTYTATGQVATTTDPKNQTTTAAYYPDTAWSGTAPTQTGHQIGDLQTTTNPAVQTATYSQYNKNGQLLQSTDANGVLTLNTYDPRGRLLSTKTGSLAATTYTYDAAGQLKKVTYPDASWIGYDFDAAHRQTAVFDNQGNRIDYTLDNNGLRVDTKTKDPAGQLARQSQKILDALSRVQQTTGQ
jgi:YD repeat-containing protein